MNITNKKELEEAIIALERRKIEQHTMLIQQYHLTTESLKPGNLVKEAFSKVKHSPDARNGIFKTVTGIGVGFLTKKLFLGNSPGFIKKIVGNALRVGVAKTAMNHTGKLQAYTSAIYNNLFKKNHDSRPRLK